MKAKEFNQLKLLHKVFEQGLVTSWGVAVDGGAHKGEWTRIMATRFKQVHAVEPDSINFEILIERVNEFPNVVLHQAALMDELGYVEVFSPEGKPRRQSRQVRAAKQGLPAITIDSLKLKSCGLIKLDVEGCEHQAIDGAHMTIMHYRPVLIVELKDHGKRFGFGAADVESLLAEMKYRKVIDSRPDGVFVPNEGVNG